MKAAFLSKERRAFLWRDIKNNKDHYLMMAPFMILFTTFTVVPVLLAIFLSFTYFNLVEVPQFRGLFNYVRIFLDDDIFVISLKNTLIFAFVTGPLGYFLSLVMAWLINELSRKMRTFLTFIFYAPSISGGILVIWSFIFSSDQYGLVNSLLIRLGFISEPILWFTDPKYNLTIIMLIQLWSSLGTGFLAMLAGLQGVDRSLYEAGAIDGIKNRFQEFIKITIPSIGPALMFSAVMTISGSFAAGGLCVSLSGFPSTDYSTNTIMTHIADYSSYRYEMGYASAIATVLFMMMIGTNAIVKRLLRNVSD